MLYKPSILSVGQVVFLDNEIRKIVDGRYQRSFGDTVRIIKVGRKYAYYDLYNDGVCRDDCKIDLSTMRTTSQFNGITFGVWSSEEAYRHHLKDEYAINNIKKSVYEYQDMTVDQAVRLSNLLAEFRKENAMGKSLNS